MHYRIILPASTFFLLLLTTAFGEGDRDQIIFPHAFHVEDMEVACDDCHSAVTTSTSLSHALMPTMDRCLECHDGDTAGEDCELCHTNPDEAETYGWVATAGLVFPHMKHLPANDCALCHPGKAESEAQQQREPPKMDLCMSCHTTPLADSGCYVCHSTLEGKRPDNHDLNWFNTHGLSAGGGADDCSSCHQEQDCEACHSAIQLEKQVHPANYEFSHAGDFLGFTTECATCHAMPEDCRFCHKLNTTMPMTHNMPGWATNLDIYGHTRLPAPPQFHQQEALDNPDYCLVCHEPATDLTCQRSGCHEN